MPKQTFYNQSDRLTNGQVPQDSDWNSRLFDEPQAEYELRDLPFRGFYEVPTLSIAGLTVNLTFPLGQGGLLAGIRLAGSGQWIFSTQAAGTYALQLDNTNAFQLNNPANAALLTVASVQWDGSSTLSMLTLDPLAANAPTLSINNQASGGGGGTVTEVNGVTPASGSSNVVLTPANIGAEPVLGNPSTLLAFLTSSEAGVRSWVQLAWNMIQSIPSTFTPSAHAATHGSGGSDPVSPANIGAVPGTMAQSAAGASTIGSGSTDTQAASAKNVYLYVTNALNGITGQLVNLGTFNGQTGAISAGGTMPSAPTVGNVFYVCNVAAATGEAYTLGGYSNWQVGDICMSVLVGSSYVWQHLPGNDVLSAASLIGNDSNVTGAHVSDALNTLLSAITTMPTGSVWSSLANALSSIYTTLSGISSAISSAVAAAVGALTSSSITNASAVSGAHVTDALNELASIIAAGTYFAGYVATASLVPPASPTSGERVLIYGAGAGGFAGESNKVATYSGSSWSYVSYVTAGMYVIAADTGDWWVWNGSAFVCYPQWLNIPSGQNLLLNGGFAFFQRQAPGTLTSWASGSYCADRWYCLSSLSTMSAQQVAGSSSPYAGLFSQTYGTPQYYGIGQALTAANSQGLRGQMVTFSVQLTASAAMNMRMAIVEWTGTADAPVKNVVNSWPSTTYSAGNFFNATNTTVDAVSGSLAVSTSAQTFTLTGVVSSACNNLQVLVWTEETAVEGVSFTLSQADLYVGSGGRAWAPRLYEHELLLCQEYYEKDNTLGYAPGTSTGSDGAAFPTVDFSPTNYTCNAGQTYYASLSWPFAVLKRKTPTVRIWSPATGVLSALHSNNTGYDYTGTLSLSAGPRGITGFAMTGISTTGGNKTISTGMSMQFLFDADAEIGV